MTEKVNSYLLIINDEHPSLRSKLSAFQRAKILIEKKVWIFRKKPLSAVLLPGEQVLVYVAGRREYSGHIIARGVISRGITTIRWDDNKLKEVSVIDREARYYVELRMVEEFKNYFNVRARRGELQFIKNPRSIKWGASLLGSYRRINIDDYEAICRSGLKI